MEKIVIAVVEGETTPAAPAPFTAERARAVANTIRTEEVTKTFEDLLTQIEIYANKGSLGVVCKRDLKFGKDTREAVAVLLMNLGYRVKTEFSSGYSSFEINW